MDFFYTKVLATSVVNLLTINAGLIFGFPSLIIPALTGILNEPNRNEFLSVSAVEASWMGKHKHTMWLAIKFRAIHT